ncbi:uncharacterized protein LOC130015093 [Mercurialis annua]|uniref:uncharacterized protein LOC130015093 n=1 Tax=Mercurialis annua TaxID=3986 RepID=UPI0024AE4310|nr:uncharacterized protein LOC130015093 [Mercurialis annua]
MQYIMEGIMEENNLAEVLDAEVVYEEEEVSEDHEIGLEELEQAPPWIDDEAIHVREELEEVNLGTSEQPQVTFVSKNLEVGLKTKLMVLLQEYKDCFAWQYSDMPGLSRTLVEHRLPIKPEFQPYRQPPRRVSKEVELKVKEEIEKLCKAGFIRPAKYSNWLANVVPVVKKNGKLRICIDFRDLNEATPKDIYAMPIADTLIDATANHSLLSFMDCFAGYNQIMVAKEDISKTAFRCPGSIGTFEWVVMPFGLRNAGATYQRAMNSIFHDLLGKTMEVYIDDVVVKSKLIKDHLKNLEEAFRRMRVHCLKLNPLKCAFGVKAGNFLGFLVHERGIEVDQNKTKAIREAKPPRNKTELQRFLGQVNYLRRFISNLAGKTKVFSELLKLKKEDVFRWVTIHQEAFDEIKDYLMKPPVLMPPKKGIPLRLYISAAEGSIGCLLAQSNQDGHEQAIYYLSRSMTSTEVRYTPIMKLCLALFFACTKLRHYLLNNRVYVVSQTDLMKYMLNKPVLSGNIGKWLLSLADFHLIYHPQKSVKGQALADFLADHPCINLGDESKFDLPVFMNEHRPWMLKFDGSSTDRSAGAGIIIVSPSGAKTSLSFNLDFECTNNQSEYEALIIGLEILLDLGAKKVKIIGDSQLVIRQVSGEYKCMSYSLTSYYAIAIQLIESFEEVELVHVPREENWEADELSQLASGLRLSEELTHRLVMVQRKTHPSIFKRGVQLDIFNIDDNLVQDWRRDIKKYLENPSKKMMYKVRVRAVNYVLIEDVLYRRGFDNLLLRCLGTTEALEVMKQTHEGVCGAHQSGVKMRWLIRRHGYFWPSILKDCMTFAKGCQSCQRYGNIQRLPAAELKSVIKPWPFRGWAIDLIGKIYPPSSKNHSFIIVATDYFTKWVVAKPLVKTEQKDVIKFIKEEIIHQFGIPQSVTTDQGTMFTGKEMQEFATDYGIKLLTSTPYYAQANGQAESSNKIIINIVQKMLEENPKDWHRILSEALWAYRTSRRNATGVSPFMLTYGHDAVLPMEVVVRSLRVAKQNHLTPEDYNETMMMELENLEEGRLQALNNMIIQKKKVSRSYNKKVRPKTFQEDELVWKLILPPGTKDREYGKWSTNWEGPFLVHKVMKGNAYWLSSLEGEPHRKFINGKYLKKYTPTIWEKYNLEMT